MLIKAGSTSRMITMYAYDATTGLPYVTAAYNDAGISLWYRRGTAGAVTAITPATQTIAGAYSSGGFILVTAANNAYRFDIPDAAFAAGVDEVQIGGVATAWKLIPTVVQLVGFDPRTDAVATVAGSLDANAKQWSGTAVASPHTAGYPIVTIKDGTGTGEIDTNAGAVVAVTTVTNLTNAPTSGDLTATMKTSVTTAATAATPVAASVTGAVGSVAAGGITSASFGAGATVPRVTLADTLTTYTGNTPQTGDAYAKVDTEVAALQTSVDDLPTNAELATALATADDAVLAAVAALNNLSSAQAQTAAAAALTAYAPATAGAAMTLTAGERTSIGTAVWASATRTLTSLSALAAQIAAAVLDAVAASYNTALSIGAKINAAGASADPLLNTVPGSYAVGTAGYVLGLITAGRISVTFAGPVLSAGSMEIVPGDDYNETEGVDAVWTWEDTVASYTTAVATFYAEREGSTDFSKACYSIVKSGTTVTAKLRLTAAESVLLTSGAPWKWQLRVAWGTTPARSTTKLRGLLGVVDRIGT